jgi:hypothetical protein
MAAALMDADMHEGSDQDLLEAPRQRQPRGARRLNRTADQPEEVEASNDIEERSDEDFHDENSVSDDQNDDEEGEEGFVSEYADKKRIHATREVPYWDQSR